MIRTNILTLATFLIFFISMVSCKENKRDIIEFETIILDSIESPNDTLHKKDTLNRDPIRTFLIDKKIIKSPIDLEQIISNEVIKIDDNSELILIKLEWGKNSPEGWDEYTMYAVLIFMKDYKIEKTIKTPITYSDDFEFIKKKDNRFYIFEYYSSPVGYSIFYIFDIKENIIYTTEKIHEDLSLEIDDINFKKMTYILRGEGNTENRILPLHPGLPKD